MTTYAEAKHSSESVEYYTPPWIVEAARATLLRVDLDPASCSQANALVQADRYYTAEMNGFTRPWFGHVFLNPPGGKSDDRERPVLSKCRETGACGLPPGHTHEGVESSAKKWWTKLARAYEMREVQAAVFVGFTLDILQTTQVDAGSCSLPLHFPFCIPSRRVAYLREDGLPGKSPPHASVIACLVPQERAAAREMTERFRRAFSPRGTCVVPVDPHRAE